MNNYKTVLVMIISLFFVNGIYAQSDTLSFYEHTQTINNRGMLVLGTWAITNITVGTIGMKNNLGVNKYFHQIVLITFIENL